MERISVKLGVLLLAFGVGITFAGVFYWSAKAEREYPWPPFVPPVEQPEHVDPNPPAKGEKVLEMVFVLDTTGSMGGLLDGAKQRIWGIVNEVMQTKSRPSVRVGLVAYRDRGDEYVTQVLPLTDDLDKVYSRLMELQAGGGGDTPEDVRKALADGVRNAGWTPNRKGLAQMIFLVGDAPPQEYANEPDVFATTAEATRKGMIVNTIQCGAQADTRKVWEMIAQHGQGRYFAIAQDGGVETIETPYDQQLSDLGRQIGGTYMAYGDSATRREMASGAAATESSVANTAPAAAKADRALNKALNATAYRGDLIQDVENGKTKLDELKAENLPEDLQKLAPAERKAEIGRRIDERKKIREQILQISKQREAFIAQKRKAGGKKAGFDSAVAAALAEQLKKKGIN